MMTLEIECVISVIDYLKEWIKSLTLMGKKPYIIGDKDVTNKPKWLEKLGR